MVVKLAEKMEKRKGWMKGKLMDKKMVDQMAVLKEN
jgi:hypothetical protein